MTCPHCRNEITGLACAYCSIERSRAAARAQFASYVEPIQRNRFAMLLRRNVKQIGASNEHIALPQFHDEALCRADLRELGFARRALWRELPERLCPECRRVLGDAMGGGEAGAAAAL
jgi:hypothetical protein